MVRNSRSHAGGAAMRAPIARYVFRSLGTFVAPAMGTAEKSFGNDRSVWQGDGCASTSRCSMGHAYSAVGFVSNSAGTLKFSSWRYICQPSVGSLEFKEEQPSK